MDGFGTYIWETMYNNSLSLSTLNIYRGMWSKGLRNGYGTLDFSLGGALYKGQFKDNKKHGRGKFITNNGSILYDTELFVDDNMQSITRGKNQHYDDRLLKESYDFNMRDDTIDLLYHIQEALRNIDNEKEIRNNLLNDYFEKNNITHMAKSKEKYQTELQSIENIIEFEELSLQKCIEHYRVNLVNAYYIYANLLCHKENIVEKPILIRMFLWQLYYDCNVHEKLLTLVEIDKMFQQNADWLSKNPHDPFEKIFFWQFLHSLITVARRLYAKRYLPSEKPDTILTKAFSVFMDKDLLPHVGLCKGKLFNIHCDA